MSDAKRINLTILKAALAAGPLSMDALATKLGRGENPWGVEDDIKALETTQATLRDMGIPSDFEVTVFPARERARYGFPDMVPVVKPENPNRRKREFTTLKDSGGKPVKGADGKPVKVKRDTSADAAQKNYWPIVAWGTITPAESGADAYDGKWDFMASKIREILDDSDFTDFCEAHGVTFDENFIRGTRGGVSLRLKMYGSDDVDAPTVK